MQCIQMIELSLYVFMMIIAYCTCILHILHLKTCVSYKKVMNKNRIKAASVFMNKIICKSGKNVC